MAAVQNLSHHNSLRTTLLRSLQQLIARPLLVTLAVIALARFVVVDMGAVLQRRQFDGFWGQMAGFQERFAPFLDNLLVILMGLSLVAVLPALVRRAAKNRSDLHAELLVVATLFLLGLGVLAAQGSADWHLSLGNMIICLCLVANLWPLARYWRESENGTGLRIWCGFFCLALCLPQAWRLSIVYLGPEHSLTEFMRQAMDLSLTLAMALTALGRGLQKPNWIDGLALGFALATAWVTSQHFDQVHHILNDATTLYLSSLPKNWLIASMSATAFGMSHFVVKNLFRGQYTALLLAFSLAFASGFRSKSIMDLMLLLLAARFFEAALNRRRDIL